MARAPRKQISWKNNTTVAPILRFIKYIPDTPVAPELLESYERNLYPGGLFIVNEALFTKDSSGYVQPPHPYLISSYHWQGSATNVACGKLAVYAGQIRVEEDSGRNTVRVLRHSFIIDGSRYLLTNLNLLNPIIS